MAEQPRAWMDKHVVYVGNSLYELDGNGKFVGIYGVIAAAWQAASPTNEKLSQAALQIAETANRRTWIGQDEVLAILRSIGSGVEVHKPGTPEK